MSKFFSTTLSTIGLVVVALSLSGCSASRTVGIQTPFEQSAGLDTPRYDDTVSWFIELAAASRQIHFTTFGVSPQGRELPLVIADLNGRFSAADFDERGDHAVLLVEACIHAGESCGKDAGMLLLRDLAEDPELAAALLENVTIVFIPIFNVDGHERFGPYGRINQNGPRQMGWRVTSQNLNLNRDFLKADTPEMRAWLRLFEAWQPDFFIDVHSTDGADYQYPITYSLELHGNLEAGLTEWVSEYQDQMVAAMAADDFPMAPYVSFRDWHDPRSGLKSWAAGPRFSQGYAAIRNRPGLLIETHMLKDYATRVESTRRLLHHTLEWLNHEAGTLRNLNTAADRITASVAFREEPFPLRFEASDEASRFEFQGVEYEKLTGEISGGEYFRFSDRPATFDVEFFDDLSPSVTAKLPEAYLVPPEWTEVIDRLEIHGVHTQRLAVATEVPIRTVRFRDAEWQARPYEGRHPVTFASDALQETRLFPAGTVVVPLAQPLARVAAHLLEPDGPDSLVQWGFFDSIFARVEYVESYVIEAMIPELLAEHPEWEAELEERKADDPEFAKNPWAIRYWFYEKTPYYDQRVGIYPVGSLEQGLDALPLQ